MRPCCRTRGQQSRGPAPGVRKALLKSADPETSMVVIGRPLVKGLLTAFFFDAGYNRDGYNARRRTRHFAVTPKPVNQQREGTMRITLRVTAGPHKGAKFTFDGHDMFIVGRSNRAHFQLAGQDRYFSPLN